MAELEEVKPNWTILSNSAARKCFSTKDLEKKYWPQIWGFFLPSQFEAFQTRISKIRIIKRNKCFMLAQF